MSPWASTAVASGLNSAAVAGPGMPESPPVPLPAMVSIVLDADRPEALARYSVVPA